MLSRSGGALATRLDFAATTGGPFGGAAGGVVVGISPADEDEATPIPLGREFQGHPSDPLGGAFLLTEPDGGGLAGTAEGFSAAARLARAATSTV